MEEMGGGSRRLRNDVLHDFHYSPNIIREIK